LGECEQNVEALAEDQIPKAIQAWRRADYREVQRYLEKAVRFDPDYAHANYLLGELYVRKGNFLGAEASWEKTLKACPDYKGDLYFYLGVLLAETGKEKRGLEYLKVFVNHPERDPSLVSEAEMLIEDLEIESRLRQSPVPFDPRPVRGISTQYDEYLGCLSPDMQLFFFTRKQKKRDKYGGPASTARWVEEFSLSTRQGNGFPMGEPLRSPFNDGYNEGGPTITADNKELYFTICQPGDTGYINCDIWYSRNINGDWSQLQPLPSPINSPFTWESQPSVSANGDMLFFASDRPLGVGGIDIYACMRNSDGSWSNPENLGRTINTPGDEKTPFLHSDSRTLYFSSDRLPGMGGFDIFYTQMQGEEWNQPVNMGFPINDEKDNLGLFVSLDGEKAYFSTKRGGGSQNYDIMEFTLHEEARPDKVTLVRGQLSDAGGNLVTDAAIEIRDSQMQEVARVDVDNYDGTYTAAVRSEEGEDFLLTVVKENTAMSTQYIEGGKSSGIVEGKLEASPLEAGREYRLNDINFASNSSELDHVALAVLSAFTEFMADNPSVKVEIQGHTDEVGSAADNLALSSRRAEVVYQYLVDQGISPSRLSHKGYGKTRPIADNRTEAGKAKNRRTVFVITSEEDFRMTIYEVRFTKYDLRFTIWVSPECQHQGMLRL
jgi:outer membrane protein OmpA-like peptidoglycan-associated protein